MKFLNQILSVIILFLFSFSVNGNQQANPAIVDSVTQILNNYIDDKINKNDFIEKIEQTGVTDSAILSNIIPKLENKVEFYLTLATLDYENNWFKGTPEDLLRKAFKHTKSASDSIALYSNIIFTLFDTEYSNTTKSKLYTLYNEIQIWESEEDSVKRLKHYSKHGLAIIHRFIRDYERSIELFSKIPSLKENNLDTLFNESYIEFYANVTNEKGRTYLSMAMNQDNNIDLLIKANEHFEKSLEFLEENNLTPDFTIEIYRRKQKALFFLYKNNEVNTLKEIYELEHKIKKFQPKSSSKTTKRNNFLLRILNRKLELVERKEDIDLQIDLTLKKQKSTRFRYFLAVTTLVLLLSALLLIKSRKRVKVNLAETKENLQETKDDLKEIDASLGLLRKSSSSIIDEFDVTQGQEGFLDSFIPVLYNHFKEQNLINGKASGITVVLFDRRIDKVIAKKFGYEQEHTKDNKITEYNDISETFDVDKRTIYYPFYEESKTKEILEYYLECDYQKNFKKHNGNNENRSYLDENKITSKSVIAVPLQSPNKKKHFGVISLQSDEANLFNEDHIKLLQVVSNNISPMISYIRSEERKETISKQRNQFRNTIDWIARTVNHTFGNFIDVKNNAVEFVKEDIDSWNNEELKKELINLAGDYQLHAYDYKKFISWLKIIEVNKNEIGLTYEDKDSNFKLKELLNNIFVRLHYPILELKLKMVVNISDNLKIVNIYYVIIDEILSNLILNSFQSLKNSTKKVQPRIEVTIENDTNNAAYKLSIIDNGEGIPENKQDRLFEKNSNLFLDDTSNFRGTGNKIVGHLINEIEGADIKIDYSQFDIGTKIDIFLPFKYIKLT